MKQGERITQLEKQVKELLKEKNKETIWNYTPRESCVLTEPKLEKGKWYKQLVKSQDSFILGIFNGFGKNAKGFTTKGVWCDDIWFTKDSCFHLDIITEASNNEVEQALIKEAKRRGTFRSNA